jgi:hypothetical protein
MDPLPDWREEMKHVKYPANFAQAHDLSYDQYAVFRAIVDSSILLEVARLDLQGTVGMARAFANIPENVDVINCISVLISKNLLFKLPGDDAHIEIVNRNAYLADEIAAPKRGRPRKILTETGSEGVENNHNNNNTYIGGSSNRVSSDGGTGEEKEGKEEKGDKISFAKLKGIWNSYAPPQCPRVYKIDAGQRGVFAKARMQEFETTQDWVAIVKCIGDYPFLMGDNDRKWVADFDWLMKPMSIAKLLEGKYKGLGKNERKQHANGTKAVAAVENLYD